MPTHYAERYLAENVRSNIAEMVDELHSVPLAGAEAIYSLLLPAASNNELAYLGANDRYFLMRHILLRTDVEHPWLYERIREVEAAPDGYLDLWARWHFKSSIITQAGALQEIIRDPDITIGIFGANLGIAQGFLNQIKEEIEQNERMRDIYKDVFWENPKLEAPTWSKVRGIVVKRKKNPKEPTVSAYGMVEGLPTSKHFRLLIFDDLVTQDLVDNEEVVRKVTLRWEMSDNLGIGAGTRRQHIGTRYSFADTWSQIIKTGTVKVRLHPATHTGTEHDYCVINERGEAEVATATTVGAIPNPVFMPLDEWRRTKLAQRTTYAAQMLQNPTAGQNQLFDPHSLRPYYIRPTILNVYIVGDPSMGKKARGRSKSTDRTAIAVIGVDAAGNKYLLDGYCHRMKLTERWTALSGLVKHWEKQIGVQGVTVGWERYGLQSDIEHFESKMREPNAPMFEIKEVSWTREGDESKRARIQRLEPDFSGSGFFIPAKVYRPRAEWIDKVSGATRIGPRVCLWSVNEDGEVEYRPLAFDARRNSLLVQTREEQRAIERGEEHLIVEPIKRKDEDKAVYDLTSMFFNEFLSYPFSPHDDMLDAMSRVYDLKPLSAEVIEKDMIEAPHYEYEDSYAAT